MTRKKKSRKLPYTFVKTQVKGIGLLLRLILKCTQ